MSTSKDLRSSDRLPVHQRVKVMSKGRLIAYAMTINIGMGGVLLSAAAPLPIGSQCKVAIPLKGAEGLSGILAEGTVIRSDATGTAVKFFATLEKESLDALLKNTEGSTQRSLLDTYLAYFKVSQSKDLADCEQLLGVSKRTFRTSFYTSFFTSIPLAILPVWLFKGSIPPAPNWVYIALSFTYGAIWLGIIQPSIDLAVFRIVRRKASA